MRSRPFVRRLFVEQLENRKVLAGNVTAVVTDGILSIRVAAEADPIISLGVYDDKIVVMGRGESQPLLPTADGVREPQNRRVEIVLG